MQNWSAANQAALLGQVQQKTGLKLAVKGGKLTEVGETVDANGNATGSKTARDDLRKAMAPGRTFVVQETAGRKGMASREGVIVKLNMGLIGQGNTGMRIESEASSGCRNVRSTAPKSGATARTSSPSRTAM